MNGARAGASALEPMYALTGVTKHYGGVTALAGVDFAVHPGIVHAVVGENGAGKSTLMKIMAGAEQPDSGQLVLKGSRVHFRNVKQANDRGIAIVFQELSLFPELDVLSNLFILREPISRGVLQRGEMERRARPVADELGLHVPLSAAVRRLTLGEQQLVEIAKALLADANVLIFDEPNSALNAAETERLFGVLRQLRARGVAVLFISHRLEEVFEIADVITVVRNGLIITTTDRASATIPQIVSQMIGRTYSEVTTRRRSGSRPAGDALKLDGVSVAEAVEDVSLVASPGEIVGLAGLEGSGVAAVLDCIFGLAPLRAGCVTLPDGRSAPRSIPEAVHAGVAMVPADRRDEGLMLGQDILSNITQVTAGALHRFGFILRRDQMAQAAESRSRDLHIVADSMAGPVSSLSGGNQQKVVIAKWLEADPRVVLLNDPTRGVDVGAKEEIYTIIESLAAVGRIVLFTSTELSEYVRLCDRVIVFYRGRTCGELAGSEISTHRLLEAINTGRLDAGRPETGTERRGIIDGT